eukprot:298544_1
MSNDASWQHLKLAPMGGVNSYASSKSRENSYDMDIRVSGSYIDSILNPSNFNGYTPTWTSPQNTPTQSHSHMHHNDLHSNPSHSTSHSASYSHSASSKRSKRKEKSVEDKFASDFMKKAKVKSVMRGNQIIGMFEGKLMLSYFRNVEIDAIDNSDMALRYLESKSVRTLKRSLRTMNETIRRTFLYGTNFNAVHEQHLLGNDVDAITEQLTPITEQVPTQTTTKDIELPTVINLSDLANRSFSSLDDYLNSPNTTYTPTDVTLDTMDHDCEDATVEEEEEVFDPLKGAQNIKPDTPLKWKKNLFKKTQMTDELPDSLPHIDEKHSFWEEKRKSAATKMFGKYFDKRGSNISHNSIWSESETNTNHPVDTSDCFLLTQFPESDEDDEFCTSPANSTGSSKLMTPEQKNKKQFTYKLSFASTVSLGSDYTARDRESYMVLEDKESNGTLSLNASNWQKTTQMELEDVIIEDEETQTMREKMKINTMRIDSLLLDPENAPPKHGVNYSLDSFLSDMDMPEPTEMEKLKYHLTEPRLPPDRRKTYNYSNL